MNETLDRLLGNPRIDHVANAYKAASTNFASAVKLFAKPDNPRPFPPTAPLAGTFTNPGLELRGGLADVQRSWVKTSGG